MSKLERTGNDRSRKFSNVATTESAVQPLSEIIGTRNCLFVIYVIVLCLSTMGAFTFLFFVIMDADEKLNSNMIKNSYNWLMSAILCIHIMFIFIYMYHIWISSYLG